MDYLNLQKRQDISLPPTLSMSILAVFYLFFLPRHLPLPPLGLIICKRIRWKKEGSLEAYWLAKERWKHCTCLENERVSTWPNLKPIGFQHKGWLIPEPTSWGHLWMAFQLHLFRILTIFRVHNKWSGVKHSRWRWNIVLILTIDTWMHLNLVEILLYISIFEKYTSWMGFKVPILLTPVSAGYIQMSKR